VLGFATPNVAVTVLQLGHQNLDGLVGMNFLRHFNIEIHPEARPSTWNRSSHEPADVRPRSRGAAPASGLCSRTRNDDKDGNIESARMRDHDRSALALLDRTGLERGATLIHTAGPLSLTPAFPIVLVEKLLTERVAKLCHGTADPLYQPGRVRTKRPRRLQDHATH
jgi:hypothetical protein